MSEKLNRLYGGIADSKMLEEAQTIHGLLSDDLTDFTNFDADFADAPALLQAAIDDANNAPTDETVLDLIQQTTNTMNEEWEKCRNKFQDTKYFIEKAFPKNRSVWNEFGYDDYDDMAVKQDKVNGFMTQFSKASNKYSTELIAVNYSQIKIDEILILRNEFNTANAAQNEAVKERGTQTQERIKLLNHVWRILQRISKASKSIYRNNYAKQQLYLLPGPSNNAREELALTGVFKNKTTGQPEADVEVALTDINQTSKTDDQGVYAFVSGTPAGTHPLKAVKPGFKEVNDSVTITEGATTEKNFAIEPE